MTHPLLGKGEKYFWRLKPCESDTVTTLAAQANLCPPIARTLACRGITNQTEIDNFFNPSLGQLHSPYLLPDLDAAVTRLCQALDNEESILVFGDYDVDGLTATAMLVRALKAMGGQVTGTIPERLEEGYGLNLPTLESAAEAGFKVVLTVDCGVSALAEAQAARALGLDLIITDHHEPGPELPEAIAVVDPKRADSQYPFEQLAGVGVAFKLLCALAEARGLSCEEVHKGFLDLVALGTVADVVPLLDENRILAHFGLQALQHTSKAGLRALLKAADLEGKAISSWDVAFLLAPRLNSAGRIARAETALQLLLTGKPDRAQELANSLCELNETRKLKQNEILREVWSQADVEVNVEDRRILILSGLGWNPGIIGIVASQLVQQYRRPAILISIDEETGLARGSARSTPDFNLFEALQDCQELLEQFGGHSRAAGLTVKVENLEALKTRLVSLAWERLLPEHIEAWLNVDAELSADEFNCCFRQELGQLAPFGEANEEPVWVTRGMEVLDCYTVGRDNAHLKLVLSLGEGCIGAIGFGLGQAGPRIQYGTKLDIAYTIGENGKGGRCEIEVRLRDLALAAKAEGGQPG